MTVIEVDVLTRLEHDVEALKAETVKLAMAFASLSAEIDAMENPRPPLAQGAHAE